MARGMSKEEFWKTVYKSELIAKMSDNRLNAYDANFSKPNFEEEFYDYCMGDGSKPRTNDESIESFFGEGRETVQEQDVDVTSDDVDKLIEESRQDEDKNKLEQAKLKYHYIWSEACMKRLQAELIQLISYNHNLSEKNDKLENKNKELSNECRVLKKKIGALKEELSELKQRLKKYRKVVWKNIKNGNWNNKKTRKLIQKKDIDDLVVMF